MTSGSPTPASLRTDVPSTKWAHRFALATALSAVPLILFGGSVTTLGAGMAVDGWLEAEGHFMPLFPVEKWFRDTATMVEHTHRLFGVLVGLFAIATVAASWRSGRRAMPIAGLLAVCAQGTLGGFRVLENSPRLAFLHGALAQAVFAFLCVVALSLSPRWIAAAGRQPARSADSGASLARAAWWAVLAVFAQVVIGAWYRHGLRTGEPEIAIRLALHFAGAFLVFLAVVSVAKRVRLRCAESPGDPDLEPLRRAGRTAVHLLGAQVLLGLFAWASRGAGEVTSFEWGMTVLHVLVGALLLARCTTLALWTRRLAGRSLSSDSRSSEDRGEPAGAPA